MHRTRGHPCRKAFCSGMLLASNSFFDRRSITKSKASTCGRGPGLPVLIDRRRPYMWRMAQPIHMTRADLPQGRVRACYPIAYVLAICRGSITFAAWSMSIHCRVNFSLRNACWWLVVATSAGNCCRCIEARRKGHIDRSDRPYSSARCVT